MLLGAICGFRLPIGPIFGVLIGLVLGLLLGYLINITTKDKKRNKTSKEKQPELILTINCPEDKVERIQDILWEHFAFGIGKIINEWMIPGVTTANNY